MARNIKVNVIGKIAKVYPGENNGFTINMEDGKALMARLKTGEYKTLSETVNLSQNYEIKGHVDLFDDNDSRSEFMILVDSIEDIKII